MLVEVELSARLSGRGLREGTAKQFKQWLIPIVQSEYWVSESWPGEPLQTELLLTQETYKSNAMCRLLDFVLRKQCC